MYPRSRTRGRLHKCLLCTTSCQSPIAFSPVSAYVGNEHKGVASWNSLIISGMSAGTPASTWSWVSVPPSYGAISSGPAFHGRYRHHPAQHLSGPLLTASHHRLSSSQIRIFHASDHLLELVRL